MTVSRSVGLPERPHHEPRITKKKPIGVISLNGTLMMLVDLTKPLNL